MNDLPMKKWSLYAFLLVAMTSGISAYASPTSVAGNDSVWTLTGGVVPGVSTAGSFTLPADVDLSTLGAAHLAEFSLKNLGSIETVSSDSDGEGPPTGQPVPEPSILALLGIGIAGLVSLRRLRKVS